MKEINYGTHNVLHSACRFDLLMFAVMQLPNTTRNNTLGRTVLTGIVIYFELMFIVLSTAMMRPVMLSLKS